MMDLLRLGIDEGGTVSVSANFWLVLGAIVLAVVVAFRVRWVKELFLSKQFEIDELEIGVGSSKVTIRPNSEDLQIAYRLWVELTTRKLGLPFEEENDVISEVYNSWYEFFKLTRELIKAIPVSKIRQEESTQVLVGISIDVLNKSVRPHLTKWQSRYRHWLEVELRREGGRDIPPQELQKRFPEYNTLVRELKHTNGQLVAYARILAGLVELGPKGTRGKA